MRKEYDFEKENAKPNPYAETLKAQGEMVKALEALIDESMLAVDDNFGMPNARQMAEYLFAHGVIIKKD